MSDVPKTTETEQERFARCIAYVLFGWDRREDIHAQQWEAAMGEAEIWLAKYDRRIKPLPFDRRDIALVWWGPPSSGFGINGQHWIDRSTGMMWGPKANGHWPKEAVPVAVPGQGVLAVELRDVCHV
jgi:hypothetical protein